MGLWLATDPGLAGDSNSMLETAASHLGLLDEALLGEAPPEGVDTDAFISKRIDVMFRHEDHDGKTREKVDRFRAAKTAAKTTPDEAPF